MHEEHFVCYWDLLSNIPSYDDPDISVKDESFEFSNRFVSHAQARLLINGKKKDLSSFELSLKDQADLLRLTYAAEKFVRNGTHLFCYVFCRYALMRLGAHEYNIVT